MPDTKITALTAIGANPIIPSTFPIPMVDLTDTSMAASGTTKKVTVNQILGAGGTATLASATITGDLTVRTNKLAVTSTGVGFGTTSPNASFQATISGLYGLRIQSADTNNSALNIGNDPTSGYAFIDATKTGSGSFLPLRFGTSDTERYRIAADGVATWSNVGGVAGTAMTLNASGLGVGGSPSFKLDVNGDIGVSGNENYVYLFSTYSIGNNSRVRFRAVGAGGGSGYGGDFRISTRASNNSWNTDAMTLDASGRLLVGTTDAGSNSGIGLKAAYSATAPYFSTVGSSTSASEYSYLLYSTGGTPAFKFYVSYSGQISATSGTVAALSDARFKENIQDIDVGLGAILALKPRKFDWKTGRGKDIKGDRGFIAQEFETVFPNLIDEWADPAPEGEAPYKSVRQDLIPVLVKAIQELTARVQTLEAK